MKTEELLNCAEKQKVQVLVLICAILVVVPSLLIILSSVFWGASYLVGHVKDDPKPVFLLFCSGPMFAIVGMEYFAVIRRSSSAALMLALTFLLTVVVGVVVSGCALGGMLLLEQDSPPAVFFWLSFVYLVLASFISLGHFRWWRFLKKVGGKVPDVKHPITYVSFPKRALAGVVDLAICAPILIPTGMLITKLSFEYRTVVPSFLYGLCSTAVFVFLIVRFGGTPGKLLTDARIVNNKGTFLSIPAAVLRMSFLLIILICESLRMRHVFASMPLSENAQTFKEVLEAISSHGGVYNFIHSYLALVFYIDIAMILFTRKKRAIHDFIAGSYVVSSQSRLEADGANSNKNRVPYGH